MEFSVADETSGAGVAERFGYTLLYISIIFDY